MKLYLVKPDTIYFDSYNDMMNEWRESGTQIAPWFLDKPVATLKEFAEFVAKLDACEHQAPGNFSTTTSYFVIDENNRLIGAASLRHYLTEAGLNTWGHIGYGVRPSERRKGYGTQILKLTMEEAKQKNILNVLLAAWKTNVASCRTIEKCRFTFYREVPDPDYEDKIIRQYTLSLIQ